MIELLRIPEHLYDKIDYFYPAKMDDVKPIVVANIPVTKKHYEGMAHKINTDKLRDMLREVNIQISVIKAMKLHLIGGLNTKLSRIVVAIFRNAGSVSENCVIINSMVHVSFWKTKR